MSKRRIIWGCQLLFKDLQGDFEGFLVRKAQESEYHRVAQWSCVESRPANLWSFLVWLMCAHLRTHWQDFPPSDLQKTLEDLLPFLLGRSRLYGGIWIKGTKAYIMKYESAWICITTMHHSDDSFFSPSVFPYQLQGTRPHSPWCSEAEGKEICAICLDSLENGRPQIASRQQIVAGQTRTASDRLGRQLELVAIGSLLECLHFDSRYS